MSSLWYVLALVLVGSALLARRAPTGGLLRMAVLWIVIFAILLGLFKAGEKFGMFSSRIYGEGGEAPSSSTHDADRKNVVQGKRVSVCIDIGRRRTNKINK